jgi:hypothetical protein
MGYQGILEALTGARGFAGQENGASLLLGLANRKGFTA